MKYFLEHVADDLKKKRDEAFGASFNRVAVVFPGKRASLFLNEYLKDDRPMLMPSYLSISELFQKFSPYVLADPIEAVCLLYEAYRKHIKGNRMRKTDETLDAFYGWGERLLADFDDIDKSMAPAQKLMLNLCDIKALERPDYLTESQRKVLKEFFRNFENTNDSELRENFMELWENMWNIYSDYRRMLFKSKMAYEGALFRDVVEQLEQGKTELPKQYDTYVFVGFNVLNEAEKRLFKLLKEKGKALFYWDYDALYISKDSPFEAGRFLRENIERFGNELKDAAIFDNFSGKKQIEFVSAATESIQAKSASGWLKENLTIEPRRTAVVLCNESLLQPVLHSLPENVQRPNITKGYPLSHTPGYRILEKNLRRKECQNAKTPEEICNALQSLNAELKHAAQSMPETSELHSRLFAESFFRAHTIINRFISLIEKGTLHVETTTLIRLIRNVARNQSMPFHGEPLSGLQIMGVLETRNLDFDNILILSAGEGFLPNAASDASFIPFPLRQHFGLQTAAHRTAVYAYYFYRLLQRAQRVRLIYNKSSEGLQKGEMSRFMTQLLCETSFDIHHITLTCEQKSKNLPIKEIRKPEKLSEILTKFSPSSLNEYFRCELSFYYQQVAGIREPQDNTDASDPRTFGTLFHETAELLYKNIKEKHNGQVSLATLSQVLGNDKFGTWRKSLQKMVDGICHEKGIEASEVVKSVIAEYLFGLLKHDAESGDLSIIETEDRDIEMPFAFTLADGTPHSVKLKGSIDRVDCVTYQGDRLTRIVDYKTGGKPETCESIESLFDKTEKKRAKYVFQTLFYALTYYNKHKGLTLAPALYYTREASKEGFSPYILIGKSGDEKELLDYEEVRGTFEEGLRGLLKEIYDTSKPFRATEDAQKCKQCPFSILCGR